MRFYGQGAGRYPTAHNVVQDCVDVMQGKGFYCEYGQKVTVSNSDLLRFYIRGEGWPEEKVAEKWENGIVTVPVSVTEVHNWLKEHSEAFIAAFA